MNKMSKLTFTILLIFLVVLNIIKITEVRQLKSKAEYLLHSIEDENDKRELDFEFKIEREGITINDSIYIIDAQSNVSTFIARNIYVPDQKKSNRDKIYLKYACNK